jgi:hypothetical protein
MKSLRIILVLLLFYCICVSLRAQNLVEGGDFENGIGTWSPWFVDENASWAEPPYADAEFHVVSPGLGGSNNALYVDIYEPGKADWYILVSKDVPMKADNMYELYLRATSDLNRTISVGVFADITSGSPFFTQLIQITQDENLYGPFNFLYESEPVNSGIKIQFGGMEGNVWVDDVSINTISDGSEYTPYNSLDDIIGDITLPHEGLPHGVPESYDWAPGPRKGAQQPPEGWTAAIAWGQLYEWAEGNPAANTRVQIRDMELYYLGKSDGKWHQLQKSLRVEGAAYVEDFVDDINKPADIRSEPDGSISVTAGDGYNFHFWPSAGRVAFPADEIEACFITVQCRLILDDPDGVDDRSQARYLMSVGGDWWESLTAVWDNWTTNADMGIGRFRFITTEWKGYNMISLPEEQVLENPPPIAGNTEVKNFHDISVNDFHLYQNYPNPFNPKAVIRYALPVTCYVNLSICNLLGQKVAILVSEIQQAGQHHVAFNGSDLPSGIYYYQLVAGEYREVKKMILLH